MEGWNPEIPVDIQKNLVEEKKQAFTLYLDFVIDGTASMYTLYPAVYFAAVHFIEALSKYDIYTQLGLTIIRDEKSDEEIECVEFDRSHFTDDSANFLKKVKNVPLFGGANDGKESIHRAIKKSIEKFGRPERNHAIILFTDAYGSNDYEEYLSTPIGQAVFFTTNQLSEEDFRFAFINVDGTVDEEASPMFLNIEQILKPLSSTLIDNVVKPLKDLVKGVSIGA